MSVADSPFDSAWKVAKAPIYHSVNTDTSDPEVADKLFRLRDELMAEGITFDAGGMVGGGRDWELDWSLQGATPDEVIEVCPRVFPVFIFRIFRIFSAVLPAVRCLLSAIPLVLYNIISTYGTIL